MKHPALVSIASLIASLMAAACSTPSANLGGPEALPPQPSSDSTAGHLETIAIVGTNDLHGTLTPIKQVSREINGASPQEYEAGGAALISQHIKILREEWGQRLLWLDAGDAFQGSIESNTSLGRPVVAFFNRVGLNAAAIGNHEYDWGADTLKSRMRDAHYPYLDANTVQATTGEPAQFPNTSASQIFRVGRAKVGVIGLATLDTPKTTRPENVKEFRFKPLKESVLREAQLLRTRGAHAIVVLAHVGLKCPTGRLTGAYSVFKEGEEGTECGGRSDEMITLLNDLPAGTVDAVVSGHSHTVVHHWINGVPVIQSGHQGKSLHVLYLTIDPTIAKIERSATRIEGPIPICTRVFRNQRDCNGDAPAPVEGRGSLVLPVFRGKTVRPDGDVLSLLEPDLERAREQGAAIVGETQVALEHRRESESPLGNIVADALRESVSADFALMNGGGVRAPIEAGKITFASVFRTLPFENAVVTVDLTGRELVRLLRVATSGARGLPSVSGLKLKLLDDLHQAKGEDLNGDGRIETWEFNMLREVTDSDGHPLEPDHLYKLATVDFLTSGGDDLEWPFSKVGSERFHLEGGPTMRDALLQYLKGHSPLSEVRLGRFERVKSSTRVKTKTSRRKRVRQH